MTVWIDSTEINSLLLIFYLIYSWVVDLLVVERLLSIWNDIKKLIKFLENLPKFKRPSCKSYNHLTNTASDILMPAKLQFFCFIAGITKYQSDKPMIPYLYSDILKLNKNLMQLIVKADLLEKCKSYLNFRRINLYDKESITKNWGRMTKSENLMLLFPCQNQVYCRHFEKIVWKKSCWFQCC